MLRLRADHLAISRSTSYPLSSAGTLNAATSSGTIPAFRTLSTAQRSSASRACGLKLRKYGNPKLYQLDIVPPRPMVQCMLSVWKVVYYSYLRLPLDIFPLPNFRSCHKRALSTSSCSLSTPQTVGLILNSIMQVQTSVRMKSAHLAMQQMQINLQRCPRIV